MSAGLDASTVTPGKTAPVVSLAMPAIGPLATACVHPEAGKATIVRTTSPSHFARTIRPPFAPASVEPVSAAETSGYLKVRTVLQCRPSAAQLDRCHGSRPPAGRADTA